MPTRLLRHTSRHAVLTAIVGTLLMLPAHAPAGAAEPDPALNRRGALALAQERLDHARLAATEIAEKLSSAQTQQANLTAEIATAEIEIPALRDRAEELHRIVRERAARLYVRSATPKIDAVVSTGSIVDAARAAHLTETIGTHDSSVAVELADTARALEARQSQLRVQRIELERTIASLVPLREMLEKRLEAANDAYAKVTAALAARGDQPDVQTGAQVCPVQGLVVFTDDFGAPRDGHLHEGIDMPALEGTPVVAVVAGFLAHDESARGGHGAWLYGGDDVAYYHAHFSRYEGESRFVAAGDVIGYVGSTGVSTGPHLHFEVHPQRGAAVNAYPLLLGLCADETAAPRV